MNNEFVWDLEANGLLTDEFIDYTSVPYKLKVDENGEELFKLHCAVFINVNTDEIICFYDGDEYVFDGREYEEVDREFTYELKDYDPVEYTRKTIDELVPFLKECGNDLRLISHNGINYDHLVLKLKLGLDYTISPDTLGGESCVIDDTMVLSKTLNPDRFGGHSLDNLAKISKSSDLKIEFRKDVPIEHRFKTFAADMLYYNIYDSKATKGVLNYLEDIRHNGWDWEDSYSLEKAVAEIVTRQEHRGFNFNEVLGKINVDRLDQMIEDAKNKIEPLLPTKPMGKTKLKEYTFNSTCFKKGNGELTAHIKNFVKKHDGEWIDDRKVKIYGKVFKLPIHKGTAVKTTEPAEIKDTTHIKKWFVGDLGWVPLEWKDRDLTTRQTKNGKVKRTWEQFEEAVNKYVEETLNSPFCNYRLEHLRAERNTLKSKLLKRGLKRSLKVLTNPSFTYGQEKDPCPNLMKIADKFPYVQDLVNYLTYRHRRNTILGGDFDPEFLDESSNEEPEKGYFANIREDGRISTPADTCGAATSRMKHRVVANVPRITSLYGKELRELFGVGKGNTLIGYDFDSLEARIEAHYCHKYDKTKEYCESLLAEKPNSVHCKMARAVSEVLKKEFSRNAAKSVRYGIAYGASPARVAKIIGDTIHQGTLVYETFWEEAKPLALLQAKLKDYWENKSKKKYIPGIDGRQVPTRSPHSILNSLFQSGGVICAKRAMVIHDRKLKDAGMLIDFFRDSLKDFDSYCQQLIAYHDEAQCEVDSNSVLWKVVKFNSNVEGEEEKAKEKIEKYKVDIESSTGMIWSDIGHTDDCYYVGYHIAGQLASESVKEAGEYYNLNVDLTAGYSLGRNWSETH